MSRIQLQTLNSPVEALEPPGRRRPPSCAEAAEFEHGKARLPELRLRLRDADSELEQRMVTI